MGLVVVLLLAVSFRAGWPPGDRSPAGGGTVSTESGAAADLGQFGPEERGAIQATLALIDSNGPYPFAKDGTIFSNREGRLPAKPSGYYREYTVITPGSPDRGPRRIVAGQDGETYYTDDHYNSFVRIR
jgi:guanyl-specific ribonuclease Sa